MNLWLFQSLVAVIVCFLLCWTPYHALRIMFVITSKNGLRNQKLLEMEETLHLISGNFFAFSFASTFWYPFISIISSSIENTMYQFHEIQVAATTLVPPSIHFSTACFRNDFEMDSVISRTNALKDFKISLIVPCRLELIVVGEIT